MPCSSTYRHSVEPGRVRGRPRSTPSSRRRRHGDEQQYLFRVLTGEMRQGANEGVVADAVAKASGRPIAEVRRAAMLPGDLGAAALLALSAAISRPLA